MTLDALDIPDQPEQLATWLEGHLAGATLRGLVSELEALRGAAGQAVRVTEVQSVQVQGVQVVEAAATPTLAQVPTLAGGLRENANGVHQRGLQALSIADLQSLLRHPRLLLELQEEVLVHGGGYWERKLSESPQWSFSRPDTVSADDMSADSGRDGLVRVRAIWEQEMPQPASRAATVPGVAQAVAWYARPAVVSLATAAAILAAVFVVQSLRTGSGNESEAWGWNQTAVVSSEGDRKAVFLRLAAAAEEWWSQRPEDARSVAQRIIEMRQGCTRLILADFPQLSADDRTWLRDKCRAWAVKLDAHLAAVEEGQDPQVVRTAADETVQKLIKALRERAS